MDFCNYAGFCLERVCDIINVNLMTLENVYWSIRKQINPEGEIVYENSNCN